MAFDFEASRDGELKVKSNIAFKKTFKFDSVFTPEANQGKTHILRNLKLHGVPDLHLTYLIIIIIILTFIKLCYYS